MSESERTTLIAQAHERYAAIRPKSAALREKALAVMPGGNTRTVLSYAPFPTAMKRGEGGHLWDVDGNKYIDLCGEYTAGLFGHTEPRIQRALHAAIDNGLSLAAVGEAEAKFAALLQQRFPSIDKVRFTNSGTEANLMALTAARIFTGRSKVLVFLGGYHGSVVAFTSANPQLINAPYPFVVCYYNDIEGTVAAIREHADDLAAVLLEPMLGGGGGIVGTTEFLQALRDTTREVGALLIFDEVMTSRMSGGGIQARVGITPDLTALGKYMGGGTSFGAFGGRADVMEPFASKVAHAGTFNNNVLTMAGGVVALGEIFTPDVADAFFLKGEKVRERLNAESERAGVAVQFSGMGSLIMTHFRLGPLDRPYMPTKEEDEQMALFFFDLMEAGIYLARRGQFALPLPTTDADLDYLVATVARFFEQRRDVLGSRATEALVAA